jgi:hypothetical protein
MLRFIFHWRRKIPGLKKYDVSTGAVGSPAGPSEIHLVATLSFDSPDALKARLASPEGKPRQEILPTLQMAGRSSTFSRRRKSDAKEVWGLRRRCAAGEPETCLAPSDRLSPEPGRSFDAVYLRAAQAYMLISMPTGTSTIFGVFQVIRVSQVVWRDVAP